MTLSLSHWYPGSGVVLDCIDSWSLPSFFLRSAYLIFLKYPMKMKYFGLTETKLFHFHGILKKGAGGGRANANAQTFLRLCLSQISEDRRLNTKFEIQRLYHQHFQKKSSQGWGFFKIWEGAQRPFKLRKLAR